MIGLINDLIRFSAGQGQKLDIFSLCRRTTPTKKNENYYGTITTRRKMKEKKYNMKIVVNRFNDQIISSFV